VARLARRVAVFAFASLLVTAADAQTLLFLHVRSFAMSIDKPTVRLGESFHVTVSAHVDEEVSELDNVTLPDLSGFEISGDERRCSSSRRGTDCVEVLTLDAAWAGTHTLGPTTLDAVDARDGKPSRFATNSVTIKVLPPAPAADGLPPWLRDELLAVLLRLALVALALLALGTLVWAFTRRRPPAPSELPPRSAANPAPVNGSARWRSLVAALAAEPTRPRVVAVRDVLRQRVGARDEETIADLIARRAAGGDDGPLVGALQAIERATFCEDDRLTAAVHDTLPLLEALAVAPASIQA